MNWIKKLIPAYFEIRSLYWVEHGQKMEDTLEAIFNSIDNDDYVEANKLIMKFESTFSQSGVPFWIAEKYAEIYKAKTMLVFLQSEE
jgi:hypothetical protein